MTEPSGFMIIERILRDREGVWRQIFADQGMRSLAGQTLASSAVALAIYGAVLGASSGWQQILSSALKLPTLFLVTLLICLPALYLFNLVFGAKLSVGQAVALVAVAVNVIAMLAVAFAPISLFFLITAPHYSFFKLLNVLILALAGLVGLRFLIAGMRALNLLAEHAASVEAASTPPVEAVEATRTATATDSASAGETEQPSDTTAAGDSVATAAENRSSGTITAVAPAPAPNGAAVPKALTARPAYTYPAQPGTRSASMGLLYVWVVVFGFVGTQLAWTLRPFVGSPGEEQQWFRPIDGNFYVDVMRTLFDLF